MKKYLLSALMLTLVAIMSLSSCRSLPHKELAKARDRVDKSEPFRYELPTTDTKPDRPRFPNVKHAQLKNGLEIFVVEDHRLPIADISLVFKNGSASDPEGRGGLGHVTALMLKEGTKDLSSLQLAEAFANLGTEVSVGINKDMTQISTAVLSDKVDEVVKLIGAMVREPRMSADDFFRVKLLHQGLLSSQQAVAGYVAQTHFLAAAYGDKHPYAHPTAGSLKSLSAITLKDIKKAHTDHYGANIAAIVAIGDVNADQIKRMAKKYLGKLKKVNSRAKKIADPMSAKEMKTTLVARANSPQTYLLIGQPIATQKDKDLPTLEVFQNILAGMPNSRLDNNLREAKGWTYGVASQVSPLLGKGPLFVTSSVQVPYGADALNEMLVEFERLKKEPISDDELMTAKNGLLNSFASRYCTARKIANIVGNQFIYSLPKNSEETFYDEIAKVTKEDVMRVANRILKKEHMVAVAVGDLEAMEVPVSKFRLGKVSIVREDTNAEAPTK